MIREMRLASEMHVGPKWQQPERQSWRLHSRNWALPRAAYDPRSGDKTDLGEAAEEKRSRRTTRLRDQRSMQRASHEEYHSVRGSSASQNCADLSASTA